MKLMKEIHSKFLNNQRKLKIIPMILLQLQMIAEKL